MKPDRSPSVYPAQGGSGISLRDYFAAAALTGIKSNHELLCICSDTAAQQGGKQQDFIARMAYADADAMLAERERKVV